ncbi:MAG TPA: hypothetical protein VEE82_01715 [Thermodesulfovibrionales bacterium]|nr:hypothetical protein [Thermodesulfovibrionales bacterium]
MPEKDKTEASKDRETVISDPRVSASLAEEAIKDHSKLRNIIFLLYDENMVRRFSAARVLGEVARRAPELMMQKWERIFRAFDDTMSCWGAAEALGEVARNLPQHRGKIMLFLRGFRRDECSCQGYIWGMCRICQVDREKISDFVPELKGFLLSQNICVTGQALWALGELGIKEVAWKIRGFLSDERETWIYQNDSVRRKTIGMIAGEALAKLE